MELDSKLQAKMKLKPNAESQLVSKLRSYFKSTGKKTAIIGLSGGIDSALSCYLASKALGPSNVYAFHLPYVQEISDATDSEQLAKKLGVNFRKIDIRRMVDSFLETLKPRTRLQAGNLRVRTRMMILYSFANELDGLVIGTGNRTELLLGYFTKYGDGGCDVMPIGNLLKTQVWEMARQSKLPLHIIEKVPSAGLWDNQTDEQEIGVTYQDIDRILCSHFDLKIGWDKLEATFGKPKVARIRQLNESSEHKRAMPPIL